MSLVLHHGKCIFPDPLQMPHACQRFWKCYKTIQNLHFLLTLTRWTIPCACNAKWHLNVQKCSAPLSFLHFWLRNVLRATTACTFPAQLPKALRHWGVLYILTSTCASRHNGLHFSTSQLPKAVRSWGALYVLTWKCASRHNGVHFSSLIWPHGWLRIRRFSEPTFWPSGATNHWKTQCSATFPHFAHLHLLSSHSCSALIFSLRLFSSLILPTSAFPSVHPVGSLTCKLPSVNFDFFKHTHKHNIYIYIYVCVCVCVCIYIYWLSTYVNFKTKQWLERLQRPQPQNRWSQWSHGRFPILSRVEICWNILKSYEMMWSLTLLQSLSNLLHVFAWKGFYLSPWEYIRIIQNPLKHHLATRLGLSPALLQLLLRLRVESGAACSCLRRHRNHTVSHFSWF